jgi:hypothetical protein
MWRRLQRILDSTLDLLPVIVIKSTMISLGSSRQTSQNYLNNGHNRLFPHTSRLIHYKQSTAPYSTPRNKAVLQYLKIAEWSMNHTPYNKMLMMLRKILTTQHANSLLRAQVAGSSNSTGRLIYQQ